MTTANIPRARDIRHRLGDLENAFCEATAEHFDARNPVGHLDELIDELRAEGVVEYLPRRTIQRLEAISTRLQLLDQQLFQRCYAVQQMEYFHRLADEIERMEDE